MSGDTDFQKELQTYKFQTFNLRPINKKVEGSEVTRPIPNWKGGGKETITLESPELPTHTE